MDRFNSQTLEEWLHHPLTKVFRQYLKDQHNHLKDQWGQGQLMDLQQQTKALLLWELSDLEWADYAQFYGIETESAP